MIVADNYNYTKNIQDYHIDKFEKDLSNISNNFSNYNTCILVLPKSKDFLEKKLKTELISDLLSDNYQEFLIVFDGEDNFQVWVNLSEPIKENLMKTIPSNIFEFSNKKAKLHKVGNNGLVSCVIDKNNLKDFKKGDATMDAIYKKLTGAKFDWENNSRRIAKKVCDLFKYKYNQINELIDKNLIEDRKYNNFYRQVREASFEIISRSEISKYTMGVHVIRRIEERNVPLEIFFNTIREGIQLKPVTSGSKVLIHLGQILIPISMRETRVLTVLNEPRFISMTPEDIIKDDHLRSFSRTSSLEKSITLGRAKNFKNLEDLKKHLNITKQDYVLDMIRCNEDVSKYISDEEVDQELIKNHIKKNDKKEINRDLIKNYFKNLQDKKKVSDSHLVSNPPYVGDLLSYIEYRKNLEDKKNKLANIVNNFKRINL